MSSLLKNLNKKYFIALGIGIAIIFLIIDFIPFTYNIFTQLSIIHLTSVIVALFLLIIALVKIFIKTFTTKVYKTIIMLLIGAIIAISIGLIFTSFTKDILLTIAIIVCVVLLGLTLIVIKIEKRLEIDLPMSSDKKNLNQKYYIVLGISIAIITLVLGFMLYNYSLFSLWGIIRHAGSIVALFILIIALVKIVSKTFTTNVYKTIITLLIGAVIATFISLILMFPNIITIIVVVICVVVLWYTNTVQKREELRPQEELSPQHKIAQPEYNLPMILFAVGGGLIVIGIIGAIFGLSGLGGLGVDPSNLNNFGGYILLGIFVGIPFVVFIVPGYYLVRLAYKKYETSKH